MTRAEALEKGKKTYNSGTQCPLGHKAKRYVTSRRCVKCDAISSKQKSKTKDCFKKKLENLAKNYFKKIKKMNCGELDLYRLKIELLAVASQGHLCLDYYITPEIKAWLESEGLEVKGNKIIW